MQAFHYQQKRNFVHQEESAFRAEGEFAKWPLRILGKAFTYYSAMNRGVPEDVLFSMIRGGLYGYNNTAMIFVNSLLQLLSKDN